MEIRRATSIKVTEVANGERQHNIEWLPSDNPEVGVPYVTFVFNFEVVSLPVAKSSPPLTALLSSPAPVPSHPTRPLRINGPFIKQEAILRLHPQTSLGTSTHQHPPSPVSAQPLPPRIPSLTISFPGQEGQGRQPASRSVLQTSAAPPTVLQEPTISPLALENLTTTSELRIPASPTLREHGDATLESSVLKKCGSSVNSQPDTAHMPKRSRIHAPSGVSETLLVQEGPSICAPEASEAGIRCYPNYAIELAKMDASAFLTSPMVVVDATMILD